MQEQSATGNFYVSENFDQKGPSEVEGHPGSASDEVSYDLTPLNLDLFDEGFLKMQKLDNFCGFLLQLDWLRITEWACAEIFAAAV